MTAEQRLAAVLALLRRRVASGDVRACVLRDVEALAQAREAGQSTSEWLRERAGLLPPPPLPEQLHPTDEGRGVAERDDAERGE